MFGKDSWNLAIKELRQDILQLNIKGLEMWQ